MQILNVVQTTIHKLETGLGVRFVRNVLIALLVVMVWGVYDWRCFQNMSAPEAMDAAQLGRNIARGQGFTTEFIRPFSISLVTQKGTDSSEKDPARLKAGHPDIANAPVYPIVLAGLMKVLPFKYDANLKGILWSTPDPSSPSGRAGTRYQPDFLIALFNQVLFMILIVVTYLWARWLFDGWVAWTSVVLLVGAEMLWRFSISGLSTMLLMLIVMGLLWCLTLFEREAREPKWAASSQLGLSVFAGALSGIGGLTRYSFLWMIIPVIFFIAILGGRRRVVLCLAAFGVFAALMAPWLIRNYTASGTVFGVNSYSMLEGWFPEFRLQRALHPEILHLPFRAFWPKLANNLGSILQSDLFKIGGGWISAFFLVSLMVAFRNVGLLRIRYFIVGGIATLAIAQALGRTQLSDETPDINSENLLILFAPAVVVFGAGMFYLLLDNIRFAYSSLRYAVIVAFVGVLWLPMLLTISSSKKTALAYPPYRPAAIQNFTQLMQKDEMVMSDVPWAVAWYGDRQSVWMTLYATVDRNKPHEWDESFFAINDMLKPVAALYLTQRSLDSRFQSQWLRAGEWSWGNFIITSLLRNQIPPTFPLSKMPTGYLPQQMVLFDTVRW